jgi:hypothetical protein
VNDLHHAFREARTTGADVRDAPTRPVDDRVAVAYMSCSDVDHTLRKGWTSVQFLALRSCHWIDVIHCDWMASLRRSIHRPIRPLLCRLAFDGGCNVAATGAQCGLRIRALMHDLQPPQSFDLRVLPVSLECELGTMLERHAREVAKYRSARRRSRSAGLLDGQVMAATHTAAALALYVICIAVVAADHNRRTAMTSHSEAMVQRDFTLSSPLVPEAHRAHHDGGRQHHHVSQHGNATGADVDNASTYVLTVNEL